MTVTPSSAGLARHEIPTDDVPLAANVAPPPPTLFDAPPALEAVGLTWETMPPWLQIATFQRWGRPLRVPPSWQALYRSAIDVAPFDPVGRGVLRVLVDWHTAGVANFTRSLAADVAPRVPCKRRWCEEMVRRLAAAGWLDVQPRPGRPSLITLTVPVEKPVDTQSTPALTTGVPRHSLPDTPALTTGHRGNRGNRGNMGAHVVALATRSGRTLWTSAMATPSPCCSPAAACYEQKATPPATARGQLNRAPRTLYRLRPTAATPWRMEVR